MKYIHLLIILVSTTAQAQDLCSVEKRRMYYSKTQVQQAMQSIQKYLESDGISDVIENDMQTIRGALLLHEYDVSVQQGQAKQYITSQRENFCRLSSMPGVH
jgi:hypothetical protein